MYKLRRKRINNWHKVKRAREEITTSAAAVTGFGAPWKAKEWRFIVRDAKRNLPDTYNIYTSCEIIRLFCSTLVNIFAWWHNRVCCLCFYFESGEKWGKNIKTMKIWFVVTNCVRIAFCLKRVWEYVTCTHTQCFASTEKKKKKEKKVFVLDKYKLNGSHLIVLRIAMFYHFSAFDMFIVLNVCWISISRASARERKKSRVSTLFHSTVECKQSSSDMPN